MRAMVRLLLTLLSLVWLGSLAHADGPAMPGMWTGSISPKSGFSSSTMVTFRDGGTFTMTVTRNPGTYTYTGTWKSFPGELDFIMSAMSPHDAKTPFWPVGARIPGYVQLDTKKPNKIYVRFKGDPYLMTLFKQGS